MKDEMNNKIKFFLDNNVYAYIRLRSGTFFNGFIISNDKTSVRFQDDLMGEIPILKTEIDILDNSHKRKEANHDANKT